MNVVIVLERMNRMNFVCLMLMLENCVVFFESLMV